MSDETSQSSPDEQVEQTPDAHGEAVGASPTLHGAPLTTSCGDQVLHVDRSGYLDLVKALHDDGYVLCADLTAADYLTHPGRKDVPPGIALERFEVIVNLVDLVRRRRIRVRCQVPEDTPELPSLWQLYPGTEAPEREVYDLFGIRFDGHPDLTRILLPEDWVGHPLRKDYESGRIPVQFKGAPSHR
ncbi:MAG: NADH-quinone oxidoreductase subunit C [Acidimicrobiales bacterium]